MPSHFLALILLGIVQIGMTVYGGYIAIKSLPSHERKPLHLWVFIALGLFGVALTVWIGFQTYESERQAVETQNQLIKRLENQNGQLATIAGMLKINSNDPAVLASALAQALHPPEKLPCLKAVHFTATQRQTPDGYETVVRISNPNGIKSGATFQLFFSARVVSIQSPEVKTGSSSSGGDIATFTLGSEVPKGKPFTILARSWPIPAQVKCVDRFDPAPQH